MLAEEKLGKELPQGNDELGKELPQAQPTLDQKLKAAEVILGYAELFNRTTSGASADYCLNWAKKRLSGKNNGNRYTPIMNLLEAPNNEGENNG